MATKTITIDLEAYERLKAHKQENESFGQTIKRLVRPPIDLDAFERRLSGFTMSKEAIDAVEDALRRRDVRWSSMNYVVGSFDLLGLSNALCQFPLVPSDEAGKEKLGEVMGRALEAVDNFRKAFSDTVHEFRTPCTQLPDSASRASGGWEAMGALTDCDLRMEQFSDLVVISGRLNCREGRVTVWPTLAAIAGSAVTMIQALASGVPFRGGIEVGVGSDWPELELLGSALAKAHKLEEHVAEGPRVLVGKVLIDFIQSYRTTAETDPFGKLNAAFAQEASGFIRRSGDGRWMVDFLGEALAHRLMARSEGAEYNEFVKDAYDFVRTEAKRFRREHDDKLARRYEALKRYFESRLSFWQ